MHIFLTNYKAKDFDFVKERHKAITSSWKCNCLSWIGQATLIKSKAQASLTYARLVFMPHEGLCEDLDALNRRFCWKLCLEMVTNPYDFVHLSNICNLVSITKMSKTSSCASIFSPTIKLKILILLKKDTKS